jgi:Transcriptional regulatory protein, C terminal
VIYAFDDSELDLRRNELRRDGRASRIEPQVSDVLVLLVRERDRVVTKEEILDSVWGDRFVSESAFTSRIKALRQAGARLADPRECPAALGELQSPVAGARPGLATLPRRGRRVPPADGATDVATEDDPDGAVPWCRPRLGTDPSGAPVAGPVGPATRDRLVAVRRSRRRW